MYAKKKVLCFHKFGCFVTCFLDYFRTPEPPLVSVGALGDPVDHFVKIFRFIGEHLAPQGLPKKAWRPPKGSLRGFLMDFGVQAEAPNRSFFNRACKICASYCMFFLGAVLIQF